MGESLTVVVAAFIALTAFGGGVAMLAGIDKFPSGWLSETAFSDYTIPALVLAIVVGGSSLMVVVTAFKRRKESAASSMIAGLIMVGFILMEAFWNVGPRTWFGVEGLYLGLGLVLFAVGAVQGARRARRVPASPAQARLVS